jgi:hypothetical protein
MIALFIVHSLSLRQHQSMNFCVLVLIAATFCGGIGAGCRADAARPRLCYSTAETRDKIASHGLFEPFHMMLAEASKLQAEAIGARLCRWSDELVYEISLLRRDGHVIHIFIDAKDGRVVGSKNQD